MTDLLTGVILVIAALGLRDAIKLYIRRKEGCGSPKCERAIVTTVERLNGTYLNPSVATPTSTSPATVQYTVSDAETSLTSGASHTNKPI